MGKKRIYELAKELNVSSKQIVDRANKQGFDVKNHMSTVDDNQERQIRQMFSKGGSKPAHQGNNHSNAPHSTSQQNHKPASNGHSTNSNHSSNAAHAQSRPAAHSNNGSNAVSRNQQQTTHSDNRTNNRNNSTHSNTANDQEIILTITTRTTITRTVRILQHRVTITIIPTTTIATTVHQIIRLLDLLRIQQVPIRHRAIIPVQIRLTTATPTVFPIEILEAAGLAAV